MIGLATVVLFARYLDISDYAAYTALMGIAGIASMLTSLGLERAVTRYVPEGKLNQSSVLLGKFVQQIVLIRLGSSVLVVSVIVAAWPLIGSLFDSVASPHAPLPLLIFLVANILFSTLSTVLQALVQQRLLTRLTVLLWGVRLTSIVILVRVDGRFSLDAALWLMAAPELIGAVIMLMAVRGQLGPAFGAWNREKVDKESWPVYKEVLTLAGHSYAFTVLASLPQGYFMRTLIAATCATETVAAYGFFSSLIDRLRGYLPLQLMYNLAEPVLIARYVQSGDLARLRSNVHMMYKINLLLLVAISVFLVVSGSAVVSLMTSGRFAAMSWILVILLIQAMLGTHITAMQMFLNACKLNQVLSLSSIVALLGMLAYLALTMSETNGYMVLLAPLAYEIVMNAVALFLAGRYGAPYRAPFAAAGRIFIAATIALALTVGVMPKEQGKAFGTEIFAGIAAAVACIGLALLLRFAGKDDLAVLSRLFGRKADRNG